MGRYEIGARRALQPDDVLRMELATDVQLSPEGERIAVVVRTPERRSDRYRSAIWIVPFDGGAPRVLPRTGSEDAQPRWSPDGRKLAFTSDAGRPRRGARRAPRRLFVADLAADAPPRGLGDFADDVSHEPTYPVIAEAYAWFPDGESVCVSVKDPPAGRGPRAHSYDRLRYKSGETGWWDGRRKHLWRLWLDGRPPQRLTGGDYDCFGPACSPDGRWVAFSSPRDFANELVNALPTSNPVAPRDIWLVGTDGGEPRRLTDGDGPQTAPSFSPNGRLLAYFGHRDRFGGWGTPLHLWVRPVDGGPPRDVLEGWPYAVGSCLLGDMHDVMNPPAAWWTPDGSRLLFLATVQGAANLYSVALGGGEPEQITGGEHEIVTAGFDRAGRRWAALIGTEEAPADVYAGEVDASAVPPQRACGRRVAELNARLRRRRHLSSAERVTWRAHDGAELDGFLHAPPGFDPACTYPLIVEVAAAAQFCHGRAFNFEYQMLAGRGYLVLAANPRHAGSYGDRNARNVGLPADGADLLAGVDALVARGCVDERCIGITGDAWGGAVVNWLIGETDRFAAACARRSFANFDPPAEIHDHAGVALDPTAHPSGTANALAEASPLARVDRVRTPHHLIHCAGDLRAVVTEAEQLFVALRMRGKPARLTIFEDDAHFLSRAGSPASRAAYFAAIADWFDTHMAPEA